MNTPHFSDGAEIWNTRFAGDDYLFGRQPNEFLRAQLALLPQAGRALCVADGEGRNSVWLAQQGLQVDAFDISAVGVAKARKLAAEMSVQVNFTVTPSEAFAWPPQTYDLVAGIFFQFADAAQRAQLFRQMVHTLRPGGLLVLQGYTPKQLDYKTGGPKALSHLYTAALLQQAFAALQMVELRVYEADLNEGARHIGRSALVGMVARKP